MPQDLKEGAADHVVPCGVSPRAELGMGVDFVGDTSGLHEKPRTRSTVDAFYGRHSTRIAGLGIPAKGRSAEASPL